MNTLRRVGLVAVSCIILLLCLLFPVSASGFVTREDLLDLGYLEGEDGVLYVPSDSFDPLSFSSILLTSEPNYPDFSPNDIPWKDAPQYVKDILIMDYKDFSNSNFDFSTTEYKVPFVCVRVNGSNVIVYVGINICVVYTSNNNRLSIGSVMPSYPQIQKSYLYRATFDLDTMVMTTPWYNAGGDYTQWGERGQVFTYTSALTTTTGKYDLYFYGANSVFRNNLSTITYSYSDSQPDTFASVIVMQPLGFQSGTFFRSPDDYLNTYASFFKPSIYPEINSGVVGDYGDAESNLVDRYNPDGLGEDLSIDFDSTTWAVVFSIFNLFITDNTFLYLLISTLLTFGIIALILGR